MGKFLIQGGAKLNGSVAIGGAKNAAVAILPAVILSDEPCILENVPNIRDISIIIEIMTQLGAVVTRLDAHTIQIDASTIHQSSVAQDNSRHMRASYYFLGALASRFGRAQVSLPGGCNLGARPIDQHLKAFSALGSEVAVEYGLVNVRCDGRMQGAEIFFDTVSVGATINSILAAVKADGVTELENVAKEPHIVDVANFLNSMGADIRGAGTDSIRIRGVERLRGATYTIVPDQIEAGTYMIAAAAAGGDVTITGVIPKHLEAIISRLRRAGVAVDEGEEWVRVQGGGALTGTNIKTMPYPGFPTDMQPQMAVLLSLAQGTSIITEGIWDKRFKYVDELRRMGARIQVDGKVAIVEGIDRFVGASVKATDLRAGAAMVIAGLVADGMTEIGDIYHIERGYEDLAGKLRGLGAIIERRGEPEED